MIAERWSEPSGHSDTTLPAADFDERPADIRGQHVSGQQWADVETVTGTGEWL